MKSFNQTLMLAISIVLGSCTANQYTITFETNGGTPIEPIIGNFDAWVDSISETSKEGHSFAGWFLNEGLTIPTNIPDKFPAENLTLYANWTINHYTLTFETNGGNMIHSLTQEYDSQIELVEDPTKPFHNFLGWFSDFNFITSTTIPITMPSRDVTFYAKWAPLEGAILTAQDLRNIKNNLSGTYFLVNDIDLGGVEWTPIGTDTTPFKGILDGKGFTIRNLKITTSQIYVGLFGFNEGIITNLNLDYVDINVNGAMYAGSFIGYNNTNGDINNLKALNGKITISKNYFNTSIVGGLIGFQNTDLSINYSSNSLLITEGLIDILGGLIGNSMTVTISNCYNTASMDGISEVGGLVGKADSATISNSFNLGNVSSDVDSSSRGGGLVGYASVFVDISTSFNLGSVVGNAQVGGLVGRVGNITISNSFNRGSVVGYSPISRVGGLAGLVSIARVTNSFNSGSVSGYHVDGNGLFSGQVNIIISYSVNLINSFNFGNINGNIVPNLIIYDLEFFTTTSSWDTAIWNFTGLDIANGLFPTLKNMPTIPDNQ
jgi:uncharacterized repeat protein (TIGR02543 family)